MKRELLLISLMMMTVCSMYGQSYILQPEGVISDTRQQIAPQYQVEQVNNGIETSPDFSELTEVTAETFVGHEDITELRLPNVELVGSDAFKTLHNLERITFGSADKQTNIYFVSMGIENFNTEEPMTKLKSFVMHQPGWSEYEYSSMPCYPYQLTYTPERIGEASPELSEVVLPQRLQYIKSYSFCNSEALTEVTIPSMVIEIGMSFRSCPNLKNIYIHTGLPPFLVGSFREGADPADITVHVPTGFGDVYRNDSDWSVFGTIVEDESIVCNYTPEDLPMKATRGKFADRCVTWTYAVTDEEASEAAVISAHYYIDGFREDGSPIFLGASHYFDNWCDYRPDSSVSDHYGSYVKDQNGKVYNVTQIGNHTFSGMDFAPVFTLPESIEYIGRGACRDHPRLETVRTNAMTPPGVGDEYVFGDKSGLRLEVPVGCADAYAAAPVWRDFGSISENPELGKVDALVTGSERYVISRHGIDGRSMSTDATPAGLYIERYSDGTTAKVCR